jgi:hypothetical protein
MSSPRRGTSGIGRRPVYKCILFARAKGYNTLTLLDQRVLISGRRIYKAAGFKLVKKEWHHSFGKELVGQNLGPNTVAERPWDHRVQPSRP